jgi:arylsulfatase A-like enzyme
MSTLGRAAWAGAGAMAVYGVVEIWFSELLHWAFRPGSFFPLDTGFAIILFLAYPVAGAVLTALLSGIARSLGLFLRPRELATALVIALFGATMNGPYGGRLLAAVAAEVAVLFALTLVALISNSVARWASFITSPWTTSLLLFAPASAAGYSPEGAGSVWRGLAFAVSASAILGLARLVFRPTRSARFAFLGTAAAVVVTLAAAGLAEPPAPRQLELTSPAPAAGSSNVLLVTLDTVRADHLSLYGYARDTTPCLRRFADSATLYTRAIAPSNRTLASHASIFTGLYAIQHDAHPDANEPEGRPLGKAMPTLAEIFARRGYDVSSVAANFGFLGAGFGLDRGFTYLDARPRRSSLGLVDFQSLRGIFRSFLCRHLGNRWPLTDTRVRSADDITDLAVSRIDRAHRSGRPYFLFVNYLDAHERVLVPSTFTNRFLTSPADVDLFDRLVRTMKRAGRVDTSTVERERLGRRYDATLAYVDQSLDRLLRHVQELDPDDRTLIVVASDHGEAMGDHDMIWHGSSLYEEQVWVPLVVHSPRQRKAVVVDRPVSLVDLFPLITGRISELPVDRAVVSESYPLVWAPATAFVRGGQVLYRGSYKLIRSSPGGALELYDIGADPAEQHDLSGRPDHASRVAEMSAALDRWVAEHPPVASPETPEDREARARLRALGYLR